MDRETEVLIVGGGLSGLALAAHLHAAGRSFRVLEARPRLGGRILTHRQPAVPTAQAAGFDLGPAWFWPGQPLMATLVERLQLPVFKQFAEGEQTYEDGSGTVIHQANLVPIAPAFRLGGGIQTLVDALAATLPASQISLDCRVDEIASDDGTLVTTARGFSGGAEAVSFSSQSIVLALPPRVAARISYNGLVGPTALSTMRNVPTWMAGHAKIVALYERPFWRDAGRSGAAWSRVGPLMEIHDASPEVSQPEAGGAYALFGFVGLPAPRRHDRERLLAEAQAQLVRLFGDDAKAPLAVLLQDWALEAETSTPEDQNSPAGHPHYGLPPSLRGLAGGRILFAGTETAPTSGGLLEGALESAERVFELLTRPGGSEHRHD